MITNQSAFVYLDALIEQKEPIYVRNTFAKRGVVVLTLNHGTRTARLAIPNIKYPVCLSNKATPEMIQNSKDLRDLLDRGVLSLVTRQEAEAELAQPGVRQALVDAEDRLKASSAAVKSLRGASDDIEDASGEPIGLPKQIQAKEASINFDDIEDDEPLTEYPNVQLRVQTLVESLVNRDMKSRQVKSELMSLELTEHDLAYINDNTQGIVQKYAKEKFAELKGGSTVIDED